MKEVEGICDHKKLAEIIRNVAVSISLSDLYYFLNTRKAHRWDFGPQNGAAFQSDLDLTSVLGGQKG